MVKTHLARTALVLALSPFVGVTPLDAGPPKSGDAVPSKPGDAGPTKVQPIPKEGAMTATTQQTFHGLSFKLPASFLKKDDTHEKISSPIPGAAPGIEYFRSYADSAGNGIYLFCWDGTNGRDRGPMAVDKQWETTIGSEPVRVSLTNTFFGAKKRVLAAHFAGPAPKQNRYLIYTTLVDETMFNALLLSARFK